MNRIVLSFLFFATLATAQRVSFVRASGQGTVAIVPDRVVVNFSVQTRASTARFVSARRSRVTSGI